MSEMKIRAILSDDVEQVKTKLGIDSYTWGEHSAKLAEALAAGVDLATFISSGTNADDVAKAGKQATSIGNYAFYQRPRLTTANFPVATRIGSYAFYYCSGLTSADFPKATVISTYAFYCCSALTTANFPVAVSIGGNAFQSCSKMTTANFPKATSIGTSAFYYCSSLTTADFSAATSISGYAFYNCSSLTALILRNTAKVCTLSNTSAFNATPIKSGTGYIYVPSALVDSYKTATNWSTYAAQFRALEDYTVDGTTTGALDSSKI